MDFDDRSRISCFFVKKVISDIGKLYSSSSREEIGVRNYSTDFLGVTEGNEVNENNNYQLIFLSRQVIMMN